MAVPLPRTAFVPPVMVNTAEPVSVRLPLVNAGANVERGSFLTNPFVIVSRLSALVVVPICTPIRVKGLVPTTCRAVDGAAVPIPSRLFASS